MSDKDSKTVVVLPPFPHQNIEKSMSSKTYFSLLLHAMFLSCETKLIYSYQVVSLLSSIYNNKTELNNNSANVNGPSCFFLHRALDIH